MFMVQYNSTLYYIILYILVPYTVKHFIATEIQKDSIQSII